MGGGGAGGGGGGGARGPPLAHGLFGFERGYLHDRLTAHSHNTPCQVENKY